MFLVRTIEDILANIEADTEIIVILDGEKENSIPHHPRVNVIYLPQAIGQRAATNMAARMSRAKYLMKLDAHCSMGKGFDRILIEDMEDNCVMVPIMYNLHAFNWVCPNGHTRYQGPSGPCKKCGEPTKRDVVWITKKNPTSTSYMFNRDLEFQYFKEYREKQKGDLVETMSLQGSCWMVTREKYWELNICDESWGSWGGQGAEVALKMWLSGGKVVCNKRTYYAHLFRTQGGDFGFPYPNPGKEQLKAKDMLRKTFLNNNWDKQTRNIEWLVEKFKPVPDWHYPCKKRA